MKPRIFISAVSSELGHARQLVANVLTRLGYEPVWQDIFGTEPGDLRQMLRDQIDGCDGLIQLVGDAYGFEPAQPDPDFGRVSYTQFEFLYARKVKPQNRTWLIVAEEGCLRDRPIEQAERRALQGKYRAELLNNGHLWHKAASDDQLKLRINELKDDLNELRQEFREWQENVAGGLQTIQQSLAELHPNLIREQLRRTIEATYQRDLAEAESLSDWQQRDKDKQAAAESRDRRLGQVDDFLASITATIRAGDASPEFLELTRIIGEQGVDAALAYVTSQQSRLFERAASLTAQHEQELRRTLAPLLEGVRLHYTRGELRQAEQLVDKLLAADANWPEALHEHFLTQIELGDRALRYETLSAAKARFQSARAAAELLVTLDADNPLWQRALFVAYERLGAVQLQSGRVTEALGSYQQALKISQKLAAADPSDAQAQFDLVVSFVKVGLAQQAQQQYEQAIESFGRGLKVLQALKERDRLAPVNEEWIGIVEEAIRGVQKVAGGAVGADKRRQK